MLRRLGRMVRLYFSLFINLLTNFDTAKNHTLFGSFEIITNQIKEIFGKEFKLKNFFPLNSFGPGYKIQ